MDKKAELPVEFAQHMKGILADDYDLFEASYTKERSFGLRINPLKTGDRGAELLLEAISISKDRIPWCTEGYYYNSDSCPGRSPYHEAGAYYIQEPSAMITGSILDAAPYERICDLCAAPGGKTTHIAGRMAGKGILISNEIVHDRALILSQNVERMGITNCVVTCASPDELAMRLPGYFHKVCVDAPCSGEGMFRKDDIAISEWSIDNVKMCTKRQRDILEAASELVMPGGYICYSTCTFEEAENEDLIEGFLKDHPEFHPVKLSQAITQDSGLTTSGSGECYGSMVRAWPHKVRGEGHFAALIQKEGEIISSESPRNEDFKSKNVYNIKPLLQFLHTEAGFYDDSELIEKIKTGFVTENNGRIFIVPSNVSRILKGIRIIRQGLCAAEFDGKRFKPDHALAMACSKTDLNNTCELNADEAYAYIRGETIDVSQKQLDIPSGSWVVVFLNGYSLGWGKLVGNVLKNHYPKGLRRNLDR